MIVKVTHLTVFVTLSKMKNEFPFFHTTKKVNWYWHVCVKIKILLSGWRGWYWSFAVIPPIIVNERPMRLTAFHDQTWCSSCFCNNNTFNEILMALSEQKFSYYISASTVKKQTWQLNWILSVQKTVGHQKCASATCVPFLIFCLCQMRLKIFRLRNII